MKVLLLFVFCGLSGSTSCTMTEPTLWDIQQEQERKELFVLWKRLCLEGGGLILVNRSWSCRHGDSDCIPGKIDWKGKIVTKNGRDTLVSHSFAYQCVRR
jgi:hypothetical protein